MHETPPQHLLRRPVGWVGWPGVHASALAALVLGLVAWAVRDDRAGRPALAPLAAVMAPLVQVVRAATSRPAVLTVGLGGLVFVLGALLARRALATRRRDGMAAAALLLATGVAAVAQSALCLQAVALGVGLYGLAVALAGTRWLVRGRLPEESADRTEGPPFTVLEAGGLTAVVLLAAVYRLYALNQLPASFDGELTVDLMASTSLQGVLTYSYDLNLTPSGLLYHLFEFATLRTCGVTFLAARLVPAVAGVASVSLLYLLVRRLGGVTAAMAAAAFLAATPLEIGWGRAEIFPFALPDLVVIALCLVTHLALSTERWSWFLAVAVLQKLSADLYPSGQAGFLIPVVAVGWRMVSVRGFARRCWPKTALVVAGAGLWAASFSLGALVATGRPEWRNPLALNSGKTLWSVPVVAADWEESVEVLAEVAVRNCGELARRVFVAVDSPTHYSPLAGMSGLSLRYLPAGIAVLVAIGFPGLLLAARRRGPSLLLTWIAVAVLPGVLSTEPEARRLGPVFPALMAGAALAAAEVLAAAEGVVGPGRGRVLRLMVAPVALALFCLTMGGLYFDQTRATPVVTGVARGVVPYLKPDTLVLADFDSAYDTKNLVLFLLLDRLDEGSDPPTWRTVEESDWPALTWWPRPDLGQFQYASSFLAERVPQLVDRGHWSRCLFLVQDLPRNRPKVELLRALFPAARLTRERPVPAEPYYDFVAVEADWGEVAALGRLEVEVGGAVAAAVPASTWGRDREVRLVPLLDRPPDQVVMRAGLFIAGQGWEELRLSSSVPALVAVDGRVAEPASAMALSRGVHELEVRLAGVPSGPVVLESRAAGAESFSPVRPEAVVAPELAEHPLLRGRPVRGYPGFAEQEAVGSTSQGYYTHCAVSPAGEVAMLYLVADGWRVDLLGPIGEALGSFSRQVAGRPSCDASAIAFVGGGVAVLDRDNVARFEPSGRWLADQPVPFEAAGEEDLAGNERGDLFAVSGAVDYVARLGPDGGVVERLAPPPERGDERWVPMRVSAAGSFVAVGDEGGAIHLFRRDPGEGDAWSWVRSVGSGWSGRPDGLAVSENGWLAAYYPAVDEWHLVDEEGTQRMAADPEHDLDRLLRFDFTRIPGFDRNGNLWIWYHGNRTVSRLAPLLAGSATEVGRGSPHQ